MRKWRKLAEELGPLLVFFALNARGADWLGMVEDQSLFIATGGFMLALVAAMMSSLLDGRRPNNMTLLSAGFVLIFGTITLVLQNETFIKIKPTLIYLLLAAILAVGLVRQKFYLQMLMGNSLALQPAGWAILTRRWMIFFIALAGLNEFIWRHYSTDVWVNFKVFGILPLSFIFMLAQMPLLKRFHAPQKSTPEID